MLTILQGDCRETLKRRRAEGMGSHHSAKALKNEWLTPPEIIRALGTFDLDPCAPIVRPWDTAYRHFTIENDGLSQEWSGRVWCNPPYGSATAVWLGKLAEHGNGTALVFARTETRCWFNHIWPKASAVMFFEGRLNFHHVTGARSVKNSGAPSALIAYGWDTNAVPLLQSNIRGHFVRLTHLKSVPTTPYLNL